MDLEEDVKSVPIRQYANIEYRYFPSKATGAVANKVNPFNTVGNYHERRLRDKLQKRNNGEIINIYKYNTTTPLSGSTSNNAQIITQDIKQELLEDVFSKQTHLRGEPMSAIYKRQDKSMSQPACNLTTKRLDHPYATAALRTTPKSSSYRQDKYNNYDQNNKHEYLTRNIFNKPVDNDNIYAEKITNYGQLHNMCNEEFVLKTMQRHARLQKIVKKLVIERQKEKQREAWNNYINELKNKHSYYSNEPTRIAPQYVPNDDEFIDDFWETRCSWEQPKPGRNVLSNVYGGQGNVQSSKYINMPCPQPRHYYERNPYCYPTSSQGRLMMLNKERERINSMSRPLYKYRSIDVDRSLSRRRYQTIKCDTSFENIEKEINNLNTQGMVTENVNRPCDKKDSIRGILKRQLPKMTSFKEQILQTDQQEIAIESIGEKLDGLIKSVNSVIVEIRAQKKNYIHMYTRPITSSRSVSCMLRKLSSLTIGKAKSESCGFQKDSEVLYTTVVQKSPTHLVVTEIGTSARPSKSTNEKELEKIIEEEKKKSEKIRKDIEELLHTKCNRQCSVEIEFDIPTREISTGVGSSLPKTEYTVQNANRCSLIRPDERNNRRNMTIAVNTDPLGLCALLQVSADTIKQLLSYMVNLNYHSYLSLPVPRPPCSGHYICNICGESFTSSSQLSDHIENHFGGKRDCCVCRHMLDLQKDRIGLFDCKYCGQRFTRAYCCELHQQACARRFGRRHDTSSNLMLLR